MSISVNEHIQSNLILTNAENIQINVNHNYLDFDITFNEYEDATCMHKWTRQAKKKFYYTLCKNHMEKIWQIMYDLAYNNCEDMSNIAMFIQETWHKNQHPDIIKKFKFTDVRVDVVRPHSVHARANMKLYFYSKETVEIIEFIPEQMNKQMLEELKDDLKFMMLDMSNYNIGSG